MGLWSDHIAENVDFSAYNKCAICNDRPHPDEVGVEVIIDGKLYWVCDRCRHKIYNLFNK